MSIQFNLRDLVITLVTKYMRKGLDEKTDAPTNLRFDENVISVLQTHPSQRKRSDVEVLLPCVEMFPTLSKWPAAIKMAIATSMFQQRFTGGTILHKTGYPCKIVYLCLSGSMILANDDILVDENVKPDWACFQEVISADLDMLHNPPSNHIFTLVARTDMMVICAFARDILCYARKYASHVKRTVHSFLYDFRLFRAMFWTVDNFQELMRRSSIQEFQANQYISIELDQEFEEYICFVLAGKLDVVINQSDLMPSSLFSSTRKSDVDAAIKPENTQMKEQSQKSKVRADILSTHQKSVECLQRTLKETFVAEGLSKLMDSIGVSDLLCGGRSSKRPLPPPPAEHLRYGGYRTAARKQSSRSFNEAVNIRHDVFYTIGCLHQGSFFFFFSNNKTSSVDWYKYRASVSTLILSLPSKQFLNISMFGKQIVDKLKREFLDTMPTKETVRQAIKAGHVNSIAALSRESMTPEALRHTDSFMDNCVEAKLNGFHTEKLICSDIFKTYLYMS